MTKRETNLWQGIDPGAQSALSPRDYRTASFAQELAQRGVDAGELVVADKSQREIKEAWIPGVEIFARKIYPQRHRGCFGEFVRRDEGILARIGLWPKQWSAARMFAYTAKGFHVNPPSVAHALRAEGGEDVIMVYGTSTIFQPEFEGRIASDVENADLPESWQKFLDQ